MARVVVKRQAINRMLTTDVQDWFEDSLGPRLVSASKAEAPRDSGALERDITQEIVRRGTKNFRLRVGNTTAMFVSRIGGRAPKSRALMIHEGTGVYGNGKGINAPIRPVRAKVLSWVAKDGRRVFAREVKGQRANPYLLRALRSVLRSL